MGQDEGDLRATSAHLRGACGDDPRGSLGLERRFSSKSFEFSEQRVPVYVLGGGLTACLPIPIASTF